MLEQYNFLFKIVVLGDSGVGKTNLVSQFVDHTFLLGQEPTVGVEFSSKIVKINKIDIRCQIWDTAGQERFRAVTKAYYNGALGAIVVFDLTSSQTFQNVAKWVSQIQQNTKKETIILLIGNKLDLYQRTVGQSKIDRFLDQSQHKIVYMETSALTGHNVNEAFQKLIEIIYEHKKIEIDNLKTKRDQNNKVQLDPLRYSPQNKAMTLKTQQINASKKAATKSKKKCC